MQRPFLPALGRFREMRDGGDLPMTPDFKDHPVMARQPYDFTQDAVVFEALRHAFARHLPLTGDGLTDVAPLFVVGLPWTGIGLVERILAAHGMVQGAGGISAMPLAAAKVAGTMAGAVLDIPVIQALGGKSAAVLGRAYLDEAGRSERRIIDTFALNFQYIGWIAQAFPKASIICLQRGAMDSVWGNFRHASDDAPPGWGWARDLMDAARYVLLFQRLMAFWRQRFPSRIHEVSYEFLLSDPEVQSRRMLAFCGLEWDAACTQNAVPMPDDGPIGGWRAYASHLGEVMEFFTANGIPLD
ncbi:sulfotransferase [Novosphingobium sp. SL115]|uniref:sulfotransferase family protein n=1 Tax=Novosphingobium sp. SL115 TaxID=2995150 RepID=UPI0022741D07|nr:sulfotransferase [Novosphingobium sp. SL115]MCY1671952.1 sulfotransferase [Novosphingobium sp. SL115]